MKKYFNRLWQILLAFYVFIMFLMLFFQEKVIFQPKKLDKDYQFTFLSPFSEHFLEAPQNGKLNLLWFKTPEKSKGVVVYYHGNAGNMVRWGQFYQDFLPQGYDFMIYDFRTYGKSEGKLNENLLHQDAQLVYDFAKKHYAEQQIIVFGRSLGTGMAVQVAARNNPAKLCLETPYSSFDDVAAHYLPFLPVRWLARYHFRSDLFLPSVKCPITIFHGTDDEIIPYAVAKKLELLLKPNDQFITIESAKHDNLGIFDKYRHVLKQFLA